MSESSVPKPILFLEPKSRETFCDISSALIRNSTKWKAWPRNQVQKSGIFVTKLGKLGLKTQLTEQSFIN